MWEICYGFLWLDGCCICCTPCLAALFFLWVFWIDWFGQQAKEKQQTRGKKLKENCPTAPRPTVRADIFHLLNIRFGQGKWRNPLKDSQDNHRLCGWLNIGSTISIYTTRVFTVKYVITPHHHRHPLPLIFVLYVNTRKPQVSKISFTRNKSLLLLLGFLPLLYILLLLLLYSHFDKPFPEIMTSLFKKALYCVAFSSIRLR